MEATTELFARPDALQVNLQVKSREAAIRELHAGWRQSPEVLDRDRLLFDLLERTILAPVCLSPIAALPHARTDTVKRLMLGVGRVAGAGVAFDPEHPHIRLVFMIAVPKAHVDEYLATMSKVSRILKDEEVRDGLLRAGSEAEFCEWLTRGASR